MAKTRAESPVVPEQHTVGEDQAAPVLEASQDAVQSVRVRILVDSGEYCCNTVVEVDATTAHDLVRGGIADDSPEAVAAVE